MSTVKNRIKRILPQPIWRLGKWLLHPWLSATKSQVDDIALGQSKLSHDALLLACRANEIQALHHATFAPYRNICRDNAVVLVGAGPTLTYYDPIPDAVHIGVNGVYRKNSISLDYHFVQDYEGVNKVYTLAELKALPCKKFVGHHLKPMHDTRMIFPEVVAEEIGAQRYYVYDYMENGISYDFPANIEYYPLVDNWSTIFTAMHFALHTRPARLYIVGCDCSYQYGQHFDGTQSAHMHVEVVFANWKKMREHLRIHYPNLEVFVINPVRLRGLFCDIYTEAYVDSLRTSKKKQGAPNGLQILTKRLHAKKS